MKDINTFNLALLGKWRWNLFQQEGQLWARVLESKYGGWRGLDEAPGCTKESMWWRDLKIAFQSSQQGQELKRGIQWRVGSGDRIKFWEDEWIDGDVSLITKYPRLFFFAQQKSYSIIYSSVLGVLKRSNIYKGKTCQGEVQVGRYTRSEGVRRVTGRECNYRKSP